MSMISVFVTVPSRDGFNGLFAIGRQFLNGETGPHEVTADELARLRANKRLAVRVASEGEVLEGKPAGSAASELSADEAEILASYRKAKAHKVDVHLIRADDLSSMQARIVELEDANLRAAEVQSQVSQLQAQVADLKAQAAAQTSAPDQSNGKKK